VRRTLRMLVEWGAVLAVVLLANLIGESWPPLKALERWIERHQEPLLAVTITLAVVGFLLLMGAALHLVLAGSPPPVEGEAGEGSTDHDEEREAAPAPFERGWEVSRFRGRSVEFSGEDSFSLQAAREAWRSGAWRRDGTWRRRYVALAGGLAAACGAFGIALVLAPAGIKLLLIVTLAYALARGAWSAHRQPSRGI
jgi:hypothetical protein